MSNTPSQTEKLPLSPQQALERLLDGNQRFTTGVRSVEPLLAHLKMAELAQAGQRPFAIVLTCSDSRSPAELIFDQGVGDLFVVRVAGNVVAPSLLASVEFAAANFGSPVVLVLGHTLCGAIKATTEHHHNPGVPLPSVHLEELVGRIRPAIEQAALECPSREPQFLERATIQNVRRSVRLISEQSVIIRGLETAGKIRVVGALLDIHTGRVKLV